MRSPLFHSAVALVAASLTGVAFAEGDASAAQDRAHDAQANQPAEVHVDTSMDRNGDLSTDRQRDQDAVTASGEISSERDPAIDRDQPDLGDGAIQAGAELEGQGDVNIETQGDVNIQTDRDSLNRDRGEIQTQTQDRSFDTTTDTHLNTQQDRDGVGASGSVELGDPDRSTDHDLRMQRDRDATGVQGEVHLRDQERSTYQDRTLQHDDSAIGAGAEIQTRQDRTYRTDQSRTQDRDTNGFGMRGEVEVGGEAQTAGSIQGGEFDHDRSQNDDWKWNSDKPHLHVDNPEKPHLSD